MFGGWRLGELITAGSKKTNILKECAKKKEVEEEIYVKLLV
jgi:hypothetical protein